MEHLKQWLSTVQTPRILDVGCGVGNFIHLLLETGLTDASIVGIDMHAPSIEAAKRHFASLPNVTFVHGDILSSPLEHASFDIVCLSNTLHHLEQPKQVFAAMRRLLKPGGALLINEMISDGLSKAQISHRKLHHFAAEIDRHVGVYHAPTYAKQTLERKLRRLVHDGSWTMWDLSFGEAPSPTKEEIEQLASTVDRLLSRVQDETVKLRLTAKGERIKTYIRTHSFAGATQVAATVVF